MRAWKPVTNPKARALARWLCAILGRHQSARGGASCLGMGCPGSGAFPPLTACPLGRVAGAQYPLAVGAGAAGVGTRHHPTARALASWLFALGGAARGRPGGAPLAWVWHVWGRALSHPQPPVLSGGWPGPTTHGLWVREVRACRLVTTPQRALLQASFLRWGCSTTAPGGGASCLGVARLGSGTLPPPTACPFGQAAGAHYPLAVVAGGAGVGTRHHPTARALASWLCALWGQHEGARGGRLLLRCGAFGVGRSPIPDRPSFQACGRGPLPTACECGGCGCGDPSPRPQRALLRAGFARCGGGTRAPGGGASCLGVGRPGSGALSSPTARPFKHADGAPTTHWLWVRGVRALGHVTTPQRALLRAGFAQCRVDRRAPGGGALPTPTARPFRCAAGAHYPLPVGAGGVGMGTRHQPHSARSCELALRAVGAARGRPGGAPLAWVWGVRGRALSHPRLPVLSGVRPGPTTHWLWVRGVWVWGTVTNPTARALASWLCGLWRQHEGAQRGAPLPWVWSVWGRALSQAPTACPLGRAAGAHYPLAVGAGDAGVGTCHHPTAHALASWLCALWGQHEGPQGGRLLPGCGASGVGRSPTPDRPSFGECGRGPLPSGCGCGGCRRGDPSRTPKPALLRAGFARCGGGTRAPGGGHPCLGMGCPGSGAIAPPSACPLGRVAGAEYPLAVGVGDAGVGTRNNPTAPALASWLCVLRGCTRAPVGRA